jgi:4-carboxymuconolactone decarboxylase
MRTMSGERLARLRPDSLTDEQRELYDAIVGGPRAHAATVVPLVDADGGLEGPFNAFLLQPRLGSALQAVGAAVRYETSLSVRAREVATLVVASRRDCAFERYAHEALGRRAGLTDDDLAALRNGRYSELPASDSLVATLAHELVAQGDLDDEHYDAAVELLGPAGVFELTTLVGYYLTLALQLQVFRVVPPAS